uniref:Cytochrome c oxidase assembly protein COX15 n=1 Tax=Macrostomum lignano TaxID=282301 RepID=A0A1I8I827_9PLAT
LLAANARQSQFGSLLRNRLRNQSRSPLGGNAIRRCHSSAPPSASPVWHPMVAHLTAGQRRAVGIWLATCAGMTAGAVVLGGLTRLTRSGLSMTNWSLFKELPPVTQADWEREFQRYQAYPEYEYIVRERGSMSLNDFKAIFWLEFLHRTWGRAIGAAFLLPAAYFWARGRFQPAMRKRVLIYGSLILGQGLLGWYMVRSGLSKDTLTQDVPRVSQYRLAAHLGSALLLFSLFTWSALTHLLRVHSIRRRRGSARPPGRRCPPADVGRLRPRPFPARSLPVSTPACWPKMADRWVPTDYWALQPAWRNLFENASATQFNHRLLGHSTACAVAAVWLWAVAAKTRGAALPPRTRLALNSLLAVVCTQAGLGIATLLTYVPIALAACHQTGSLALLGTATWLMHELRRLP